MKRILAGVCVLVSVAAFGPAQARPRAFVCRADATLTWEFTGQHILNPELSYTWTIQGQGNCKTPADDIYKVSFSGTSPVYGFEGTGLCRPTREASGGYDSFDVSVVLTRALDGTKSSDFQKWRFNVGFGANVSIHPGPGLFIVGSQYLPLLYTKRGAGVISAQGCNSSGTPAKVVWAFTRQSLT